MSAHPAVVLDADGQHVSNGRSQMVAPRARRSPPFSFDRLSGKSRRFPRDPDSTLGIFPTSLVVSTLVTPG